MATLVCLVLPAAVDAQTAQAGFTGFLTGSIGAAHGGDVRGAGWTPAVSVAIVDASGWGAELDLGHVGEIDATQFRESGITTLMLNATWVSNEIELVRPYASGGLGLLRTRTCEVDCQASVSRTDLGFDAGAGAFVLFNETIGVRGDVRYFRYLQRHADLPGTGVLDFWRTSVGVTVSWPVR